jgi:serine/threonine protein kinase
MQARPAANAIEYRDVRKWQGREKRHATQTSFTKQECAKWKASDKTHNPSTNRPVAFNKATYKSLETQCECPEAPEEPIEQMAIGQRRRPWREVDVELAQVVDRMGGGPQRKRTTKVLSAYPGKILRTKNGGNDGRAGLSLLKRHCRSAGGTFESDIEKKFPTALQGPPPPPVNQQAQIYQKNYRDVVYPNEKTFYQVSSKGIDSQPTAPIGKSQFVIPAIDGSGVYWVVKRLDLLTDENKLKSQEQLNLDQFDFNREAHILQFLTDAGFCMARSIPCYVGFDAVATVLITQLIPRSVLLANYTPPATKTYANHSTSPRMFQLIDLVRERKRLGRLILPRKIKKKEYFWRETTTIFDGSVFFLSLLNLVGLLHLYGVTHNNIKPDTILIDYQTCEGKLIDFGKARLFDIKGLTEPPVDSFKSRREKYLAPTELSAVINTFQACVQSDIWAIANTHCWMTHARNYDDFLMDDSTVYTRGQTAIDKLSNQFKAMTGLSYEQCRSADFYWQFSEDSTLYLIVRQFSATRKTYTDAYLNITHALQSAQEAQKLWNVHLNEEETIWHRESERMTKKQFKSWKATRLKTIEATFPRMPSPKVVVVSGNDNKEDQKTVESLSTAEFLSVLRRAEEINFPNMEKLFHIHATLRPQNQISPDQRDRVYVPENERWDIPWKYLAAQDNMRPNIPIGNFFGQQTHGGIPDSKSHPPRRISDSKRSPRLLEKEQEARDKGILEIKGPESSRSPDSKINPPPFRRISPGRLEKEDKESKTPPPRRRISEAEGQQGHIVIDPDSPRPRISHHRPLPPPPPSPNLLDQLGEPLGEPLFPEPPAVPVAPNEDEEILPQGQSDLLLPGTPDLMNQPENTDVPIGLFDPNDESILALQRLSNPARLSNQGRSSQEPPQLPTQVTIDMLQDLNQTANDIVLERARDIERRRSRKS